MAQAHEIKIQEATPEDIDKMGQRPMTRAERRRFDKEANKKKAVYNFTEKQLKGYIAEHVRARLEKATDKIIAETIENSLAVTICTLNQYHDFNEEMVGDFVKCYNSIFDNALDDERVLEDAKATARMLMGQEPEKEAQDGSI